MSLLIEGIATNLDGCGVTARFVLEALACGVLRDNDDFPCTAKALAKRLHVSEKVITCAVAELVSVGVLSRFSKPVGRGRPAISFHITPAEIALLKEKGCSYGFHVQHLSQLFSGVEIVTNTLGAEPKVERKTPEPTKSDRTSPLGARGQLSADNRLLLGALLAHADRFGVVKGVGSVELRRLTGLDPESLKYRLQRLVALGWIRRQVPGLSSSIFNGGKISSTYYLNLNHSGFVVRRSTAVIVHVARDRDGQRIDHGEILRRDVRASKVRHAENPIETPKAVIRFLAGQKIEVFEVLQHMLLGHASDLLSRHWFELGHNQSIDDGWLQANIAAALQKPARLEAGQAEAESAWGVVISHFCAVVMDMAKEFKSRFSQANWIGFEAGGLSILPASEGAGYQVITMVLQPPPLGVPECMELLEERYGVVNPKTWSSEVEMSLDNRRFCGLASRPARWLMKD